VAVGAGLLAIVAADAQLLVDDQHVGRFADAVVDQKARDRRIHVDGATEPFLLGLDELVDLLPPAMSRLALASSSGSRASSRAKASPSMRITSDLIAARTVAVRGPPSISAISPT
jgi:hypothetical protein